MQFFPNKIALWQLTIWLIFFINPFIDAITGFIVLSDEQAVGGLGSPSQLFRLGLSVLMMVQIHNRSHILSVLLFIIYLICLELFNFIFHNDIGGLAVGITYSYKTAFGLLMYFVLNKYITKKYITINKLIDYIIISGVIYSGIVLLSDLAGISFYSYVDVNLGSRGVFASANGLGIYVGVCSLITIYRYHNNPKLKYLFFYVLMAYVLLGLMTRAALGMLLISLILWFIRMPRKYKLPVLGIAVIIIFVFITPITQIIEGATEMIVMRFKDAEISFQGLVIGGRQELFNRALEHYTTEGPLWYRTIIGGGYFLSYRNPFNIAYQYSPILEADLWDVFYMFGIIGIIAYFWLFLYGLLSPNKIKKSANYILKIGWIGLFFHSAFAGHVIQNGQSVMMIVCLLILLRHQTYEQSDITQAFA